MQAPRIPTKFRDREIGKTRTSGAPHPRLDEGASASQDTVIELRDNVICGNASNVLLDPTA